MQATKQRSVLTYRPEYENLSLLEVQLTVHGLIDEVSRLYFDLVIAIGGAGQKTTPYPSCNLLGAKC